MPGGGVALVGVVWGLLALLVYVGTTTPGVGWGDSGMHQYRVLTGQVEHAEGLALSHPLHFWLGRAALALPLGEPAGRLNLLSALFGAIGVGFVATLIASLTRNAVAASLGAAALLVAHSYWQMSVVTEVYTTAAAWMTIEWYLLLRYTRSRGPLLLVALFAVNGLHLGAHQFGLLTLVTYVAVVVLERFSRRRVRAIWLLAAALAWAVAAAPFWLMIVDYARQTGDLPAAVHAALFGGHAGGDGGWADQVLNLRISFDQIMLFGLSFGYCFPSLVLPLALVGLLRPARRRTRVIRRVLMAQTIIIGGFVARYSVVDVYTFLVPVCALVAVWYGLGVDGLLRRLPRRRGRRWLSGLLAVNALLPLAVYWYFPLLAEQRQWMGSRLRDIPQRHEYLHFFRPWRVGDDSAAVFARAALDHAGPDGWLLGDDTTAYTAAYVYLQHGGPENLRIYAQRTRLDQPGYQELSDHRLAEFLAADGRVVVIPGAVTERTWAERFSLDRTDSRFWIIRPPGAVQGDENRVHFPNRGNAGRDDRRGERPP